MSAKSRAAAFVERVTDAAVIVGLVLMFAGAGLFIYVIFVMESRAPDEGGVLVTAVKFPNNQRGGLLSVPAFESRTRVQPRLKFAVDSEYELRRTREYSYGKVQSTELGFRQWVKFTMADEGGAVLRDETVLVNWDTASDPSIPGYDEPRRDEKPGGPVDAGVLRLYDLRPPILVPAGRKTVLRVEFLPLPPGDAFKPMEDPATQLGTVRDVELSIYRDVVDTLARSRFKAEAPTWGIYAGLTGLALFVLGIYIGSRNR